MNYNNNRCEKCENKNIERKNTYFSSPLFSNIQNKCSNNKCSNDKCCLGYTIVPKQIVCNNNYYQEKIEEKEQYKCINQTEQKRDTGLRGGIGPRGNTGPMGPEGPQGLRGPKGDMGPMGYCGPPGPEGQEGPMGIMGPPGPQGPEGPQGQQGPQGAQGPRGCRGTEGAQGAQGNIGPTGATGPIGITGPVGNFVGVQYKLVCKNEIIVYTIPNASVIKLNTKVVDGLADIVYDSSNGIFIFNKKGMYVVNFMLYISDILGNKTTITLQLNNNIVGSYDISKPTYSIPYSATSIINVTEEHSEFILINESSPIVLNNKVNVMGYITIFCILENFK